VFSTDDAGSAVQVDIRVSEITERSLLEPFLRAKYDIYDRVYRIHNSQKASQLDRADDVKEKYDSGQTEFTYGEVLFHQFLPLLKLAEPQPGDVLWDIGCGGAKPQIIAALEYPGLKSCRGVELLDNLFKCAQNAEVSLNNFVEQYNSQENSLQKIELAPIEIIQGDILKTDWANDADIVYISSVCFPDTLMRGIAE
jgi:hypothetical protein